MKNPRAKSSKSPIGSFVAAFEDECAICRAEAQAQRRGKKLSVEEYIEAEQQAKREGDFVGTIGEEDLRTH